MGYRLTQIRGRHLEERNLGRRLIDVGASKPIIPHEGFAHRGFPAHAISVRADSLLACRSPHGLGACCSCCWRRRSFFRTVRESNPLLPLVLSVNLDGQHGTLLAGSIVSNLLGPVIKAN